MLISPSRASSTTIDPSSNSATCARQGWLAHPGTTAWTHLFDLNYFLKSGKKLRSLKNWMPIVFNLEHFKHASTTVAAELLLTRAYGAKA